jgi:diaminopropionate ammonia-lyase
MAAYLGVPARIFVPSFMPAPTRARIEGEGAEVTVVDGDYNDSVAAAKQEADKDERSLLVMDFGWEGYERIPQVRLPNFLDGSKEAYTVLTSCSGLSKATARC